MNLRLFIVTLVFLLLSSFQVHAQTSQTPVTTGLAASFLDFNGPLTGDYTDYKTFSPGIRIGANAFLSRALNFGLNTTFVPQVNNYPISNGELSFIGTSLIDVNAMLQVKSNGTFFKEEAFFAPYISVGFGLNTASNNLRLYVPGAVGVKLRMSKNFNLMFEGMYKYGFGEGNYQALTYSAGFVFALPADPKQVKERPQKPTKKEMPIASAQGQADADGDGVLDRDDLCPDEPGKAMYLGCPEDASKAAAPIAEENPETTQKTGITDNPPKEEIAAAEVQQYEEQPATIYEEPKTSTYEETPYSTANEISAADQSILNTAMDNIYFKRASDELTYESYPVLDQLAQIMNKYPEHSLEVLGFTDNAGDSRSNKVLSVKRAYRVKYYLVYEKGIKLARITSDGNGSASPISSNDSAEGRAKNRRVELRMEKSQSGLGLRAN